MNTAPPAERRPLRLPSLRRDIGLQLLTVYLLFVLPVALAGLAFDVYSSARLRSEVEAADLALARAIALETDARIADAIEAVRALGTNPAVLTADPERMLSLFADVAQARPDVNLIYRLDADGVMLFHFPVGPGSTVGTDFSFRPYFQKARATLGPVISDGRISPTTNQPVATAVMPLIDDDGRFLGVVATNITLQSLSQTLRAIAEEHAPEERFRVSIVDGAGQAIAEPDPARLLTARQDELPDVVPDVLSGREGTHVGESGAGEELLHAYVPIPSAGWGVIVERSAVAAFAAARAFHFGLLAAIGVFLVGGLLFWVALSRRVIQPLERLAAYSRTIGRPGEAGRPEREGIAPLSQRPDQMGHLTRSLERMERSVEERLRELETLLDTGRTVVATLDSGVVLDRILEQTGRLTGAETCAIIALDSPANTFRVRASRGLSQRFIDHLRIDPSTPDSPSMRAIRSGEPIQVSDTEDDPSYRPFRDRARSEGYRALLAVPLLTQHAPPATLVVYHRSPHRFTDREVRLVWSFATHAAMAIENSELFARSDEQLQEQTRRLESLIQSMHDALILEDPAGAVLYANRRACDLAGVSPEEALGLRGDDMLARLTERSTDPAAARRSLAEALASPVPPPITFDLRRSTRTISLRLSSFAVTDPQGALLGRGEILQDITREAELDRMKTSLVATVSHELRTPLAAVKGYASTLLADDVRWDEGTQREFLRVISQESDRLSQLVDDLLDLSRLEGGSLIVNRETWELRQLIDSAAASTRVPLGDRLEIRLPDPDLVVRVDRRRIESVLRNLLENASVHAGPAARVRLSAETDDGRVVVRVADDGPGIPPDQAERVFDPFVRIQDGLERRGPGAGLGLAISRGFVHAHGGRIWLEPVPQGSVFAFSIPHDEAEGA